MVKVRPELTKAHCPHATSTPRLQQILTCPFKMQHCPMLPFTMHLLSSLCGTLLHMGSARVAHTAYPCHKKWNKSRIWSRYSCPTLSCCRHSRASIARLRLLARWLSYNQSSNPIIQSNWTQCSCILHSDNAHPHRPSIVVKINEKRYQKKAAKIGREKKPRGDFW